ncbi:carbohydrate ABC transporter permease [Bacillus gobiensis]|uniref:carbohydrate ABC transporter permease n=1 Tax=Bacillus gobiensis TaxID=1441095 RepID=UPI003D1A38E9
MKRVKGSTSYQQTKNRWNLIKFAILLVTGITMIIPFLWMVSVSFEQDANVTIPFPPRLIPEQFSLLNYQIIFENVQLFRAYLNSSIVTFSSVILQVFTSLLAGYAFSKGEFKGKKVLFILVLATMMIPIEARLIPLYTMFNKIGMLNSYTPLIAPSILYGFGIFLCKQYFDQLPSQLREAAQIDGAGELSIFFKVYLPLTGPITATMCILSFMNSWNELIWPLIALSDQNLQTIPLFLAGFSLDSGTRYAGLTMGLAALSILPIIVAFLFLQRYIIQSIALSGLKGE